MGAAVGGDTGVEGVLRGVRSEEIGRIISARKATRHAYEEGHF